MKQAPADDPRQDVRALHERHMAGGQDCYFTVTNGRLQARAGQRYWLDAHRKKAAHLLALLRTDRFADLGCGEGHLTLPLSHRSAQNVGLDFAANALQVLREQPDYDRQRLHLVAAAGDALPLPDASVDKLLCNHVLEHVLDDDAVGREVHRVVRPGGLLLIGVPLELSPQIRLLLRLRQLLFPHARQLQLERVEAGRLVPELIGKQGHIRFYSLQSVLNLLERNGFRTLRAEGIGLSLRGPLAGLFRRNRLLFGLSTVLGHLFPSIGDGVLVLASRKQA
jgi:SAM-dependent methyltransferase